MGKAGEWFKASKKHNRAKDMVNIRFFKWEIKNSKVVQKKIRKAGKLRLTCFSLCSILWIRSDN